MKTIHGSPEAKLESSLELETELQNGLQVVDFSYPQFEVIITPEFARWGLQDIQTGRKISKLKVETLKRAIASDDYKMIGDPIRFGAMNRKTGLRPLYDGGHRLTAISQSQKAVRAHVIMEFPKNLWAYLDSHRPRTASDLIANVDESVHNATRLATAARLTWHLERKLIPGWNAVTLSNAEILDVLERHDELYHWTTQVMRGPLKMGGVVACIYWLMATGDPRAEDYVSKLTGPAPDLHMSDPIARLREKIREESVYLSRNNKGRADLLWLIFNQWKRLLAGKMEYVIRKEGFSLDRFPWPGGAPYLQQDLKLSA
jgi:hypothetical protein